MSDHETRKRSVRRKRRENVEGGRRHSHRVLVSPEEEGQLLRMANAQGVTVPRLLVESTLAAGAETPTERRAAMAELFAQRRLLTNVASNVNQIARHANTVGEVPPDAREAIGALRGLVDRIDAVIDGLSAP
jgi:hypothetical protein